MTPWMDALNKLRFLGYQITLDKGKLRYAYQRNDSPLHNETTPLLEVLKAHKAEILKDPYFLIEQTIQEINKAWKPGTLSGLKPLPGAWQRMLSLEDQISRKALAGDIDGLKKALEKYKGLFSVMDSRE